MTYDVVPTTTIYYHTKVTKMKIDVSDTIQAHGGAGVHSDLPLAGFYAYARSSSHPSPIP